MTLIKSLISGTKLFQIDSPRPDFFFKHTRKLFPGHDLQLFQNSLKLVQWFGFLWQIHRHTHQGILKGKYHCTIDLLLDWFGLVCFANKNKNCHLSYSWFQTDQTGGQQYSDTSPFSIPCTHTDTHIHIDFYILDNNDINKILFKPSRYSSTNLLKIDVYDLGVKNKFSQIVIPQTLQYLDWCYLA